MGNGKYPTTPATRRYTTLWKAISQIVKFWRIDDACDTDITKDTADAGYSAADMNQTPYQQQHVFMAHGVDGFSAVQHRHTLFARQMLLAKSFWKKYGTWR